MSKIDNIDGWVEHFREIDWLDWLGEAEFRTMWKNTPESDRAEKFIKAVVRRKSEECVTYSCKYGNCSVFWHPFFGNTGGLGPAGCECENLDDPRSEEIL